MVTKVAQRGAMRKRMNWLSNLGANATWKISTMLQTRSQTSHTLCNAWARSLMRSLEPPITPRGMAWAANVNATMGQGPQSLGSEAEALQHASLALSDCRAENWSAAGRCGWYKRVGNGHHQV